MMSALLFSLLISVSPDLTTQNKDYWIGQLSSSSAQLRINALQTLSELKYPDTISAIAERLKDDDSQVRFAAIRALSMIAHPDSLASISNALDQEQDSYLKSEMRRGKKSLEDLLKQETNDSPKEKKSER
jgi:HEAT repeat protein